MKSDWPIQNEGLNILARIIARIHIKIQEGENNNLSEKLPQLEDCLTKEDCIAYQ